MSATEITAYDIADCSGYLAGLPVPFSEGEVAQIHVLERDGMLLSVELQGDGVGKLTGLSLGSRIRIFGRIEAREDDDGTWRAVLVVRR